MAEPAGQSERKRPLWRNANFTLMWTSIAASGFGDRLLMFVGLPMLGVGTAMSQENVRYAAAINFFFFLPYLLVGPPAGWLADTLPRKWVLLGCDELRAVVLLLAIAMLAGATSPAIDAAHHWQLYAIVFAVGCFAATANPARNALVPQIIPPGQLQSGNAIIVGIATIASLLGVQAAKWIIDANEVDSIRLGIFIAVAFYGVSGWFFAFIRVRSHGPVGYRGSEDVGVGRLFAALGYVRRHRSVRDMVLLDMLVWAAAMVVFNGLLAVAERVYDFTGDVLLDRYADLIFALGAGSLGGSLFVAWMNTRRESAIIALVGLLGAGVCTIAVTAVPVYALGLAFAFGVGFFGFTSVICVITLLQAISPNYMRGRVMGINVLASTLSNVLVNLIIWRLPEADYYMLTLLYATGAALILVALRGLWRRMFCSPLPRGQRDANFFWHLNRIYMLVWHRVQWRNRQRVPMHGPVILASNHTAGTDPFLIQAGVMRVVRWLMLKRNQFFWMTPLWRAIHPIVIDDGERNPMRQLRALLGELKQGGIVGIFPEGGLQRDHRNLQPFATGVGLLAARSDAWVVPVWVTGTPVHKSMLVHFLKPSRSWVTFGQPYQVDKSLSHEQIVEDLRQRMVALAKEAEAEAQ